MEIWEHLTAPLTDFSANSTFRSILPVTTPTHLSFRSIYSLLLLSLSSGPLVGPLGVTTNTCGFLMSL